MALPDGRSTDEEVEMFPVNAPQFGHDAERALRLACPPARRNILRNNAPAAQQGRA